MSDWGGVGDLEDNGVFASAGRFLSYRVLGLLVLAIRLSASHFAALLLVARFYLSAAGCGRAQKKHSMEGLGGFLIRAVLGCSIYLVVRFGLFWGILGFWYQSLEDLIWGRGLGGFHDLAMAKARLHPQLALYSGGDFLFCHLGRRYLWEDSFCQSSGYLHRRISFVGSSGIHLGGLLLSGYGTSVGKDSFWWASWIACLGDSICRIIRVSLEEDFFCQTIRVFVQEDLVCWIMGHLW